MHGYLFFSFPVFVNLSAGQQRQNIKYIVRSDILSLNKFYKTY